MSEERTHPNTEDNSQSPSVAQLVESYLEDRRLGVLLEGLVSKYPITVYNDPKLAHQDDGAGIPTPFYHAAVSIPEISSDNMSMAMTQTSAALQKNLGASFLYEPRIFSQIASAFQFELDMRVPIGSTPTQFFDDLHAAYGDEILSEKLGEERKTDLREELNKFISARTALLSIKVHPTELSDEIDVPKEYHTLAQVAGANTEVYFLLDQTIADPDEQQKLVSSILESIKAIEPFAP